MFTFKPITLGEYDENKLIHIKSECGKFVLFQCFSGNIIVRSHVASTIVNINDVDMLIKSISNYFELLLNCPYKDIDSSVYEYARAIDKQHKNILKDFTQFSTSNHAELNSILFNAICNSVKTPIIIVNLMIFIDSIKAKPQSGV